jgi:hypothetical protein
MGRLGGAGPAEWALEDPTPRATYASSYARRFLRLEPQIAAFRRGAETILAVGWAIPADAALLHLPDLPPGEHVLELEVSWPDAAVVRSRRDFVIRR